MDLDTELETFRQRLFKPMAGRHPEESHRAATPLELFYDLVFVVAIATAAAQLHHGILENHVGGAVMGFFMAFMAIWWAWMQFTWFASAYDNDDFIYRVSVFVQMSGALVFAAGIKPVFESQDFSILIMGYVIIRMSAIAMWLRAAKHDKARRKTALRYATGITFCQFGWLLLLFVPFHIGIYLALLLFELAVPVFAEKADRTSWHRSHITERFGLLTIIVLGESVLAASVSIQSSLEHFTPQLALVAVCSLLLLFSLWWLYFMKPLMDVPKDFHRAFQWGYGHFFIFASIAAIGAGISIEVDALLGHSKVSDWVISASVAIPCSVFTLALWFCHQRMRDTSATGIWLLFAALHLISVFVPYGLWLNSLLMVALAIIVSGHRHREQDKQQAVQEEQQ